MRILVVKYYDSSKDNNNIYILMEYCKVEKKKKVKLNKNRILV